MSVVSGLRCFLAILLFAAFRLGARCRGNRNLDLAEETKFGGRIRTRIGSIRKVYDKSGGGRDRTSNSSQAPLTTFKGAQ
jgi:hypothetical protein